MEAFASASKESSAKGSGAAEALRFSQTALCTSVCRHETGNGGLGMMLLQECSNMASLLRPQPACCRPMLLAQLFLLMSGLTWLGSRAGFSSFAGSRWRERSGGD
eukprot:767779-Hanusia_phi.AAC.4